MRRIDTSGGLELGPREGPWIDIIPMPKQGLWATSTQTTLRDGVRVALRGQWYRVGGKKASNTLPPSAFLKGDDWEGVVGIEGDVSVRFLHRPGQSVTLALKAIERHEGGLPPAMVGAIFAATKAKTLPTAGTSIIADACALQPPGQSNLSRKDVTRLADVYLGHVASRDTTQNVEIPGGATDRARFWVEIARRLWCPKMRRRLQDLRADTSEGMMVGVLAFAGLTLGSTDSVEIAGINLHLGQDAWYSAWPQAQNWQRDHISPKALQFLTGGRFPAGTPTVDRAFEDSDEAPEVDRDVAQGLTASLLREAEKKAVYVPSGQFVVSLPDGYPLRRDWGVSGLRVYAAPDHLWVMTLDEDGQTSTSFRWAPGEPLSRWVVSELAEPVVDVTMAALWRDLRCAGSEAVPTPSGARRRQRRRETKETSRPHSKRQRRTVRHLPRPRRIALGGERNWGDRVDRETIERRAHGVRGHLRRLRDGWAASDDAKTLARSYGITLPDGHTFVRPHVRGGKDAEAPAGEVVVVAQGLATVMSLL
jgi:hypothetical protein